MTTVVRVCEATYDSTLVGKEGIQVLVSFNITVYISNAVLIYYYVTTVFVLVSEKEGR